MAAHKNVKEPQRDTDNDESGAAGKQLIIYKSAAEYEKKIAQLSQENFDLRLYCYNLEEKIKKTGSGNNAAEGSSTREISKLESQVRSLQQSVERKANLLLQGSATLDQVRQELEAALKSKQQLCCAVKQRDCEIKQLAAGNSVLSNAVCQLQQQLRCMEQRCQACNARVLELEELVRRRDCELDNVRACLRECGECLQQMVLAEEQRQRQATGSEAVQAKLSQAEEEIERLRAENANLMSRLEAIPQLQRDVELLEQEDKELRVSLKEEQRKSTDMRLLYEKQLNAMRGQIDELKDSPSKPLAALIEEDDSGLDSQGHKPQNFEESSSQSEFDDSENLSESQASKELDQWNDASEKRLKKLEKLQKSGELHGAKLNDHLEELTLLMQKKLAPLFRQILRDISEDDDGRLLNRMQCITDACADELNFLFDSARNSNNQLTQRDAKRRAALTKEATEAHALLRSLVIDAARKWRKDGDLNSLKPQNGYESQSSEPDALSDSSQPFSVTRASNALNQWNELCEQRLKNIEKLQNSGELHAARLHWKLEELTRLMQKKLVPLFRRITEEIDDDEDGRLLRRMQCITDACADELNILFDSAKNRNAQLTQRESQQLAALSEEATEAHALLRSLVADAARKWRKDAETKLPEALTNASTKQYVDLLDSNPPIDQMLQILRSLKQAMAEHRQAIGTDEELQLAFDKIAQIIEALNKCLQRARVELKKTIENSDGQMKAEEKAKLEAVISLLKEILNEFSEQLRLLSGEPTKTVDSNDLIISIEKFFAELEESNSTMLAEFDTLDRIEETDRKNNLRKRLFEHFLNQQNWLSKQLSHLENLIREQKFKDFSLTSSLEARANDIDAKMDAVLEKYTAEANNKTDGEVISTDDTKSRAVENIGAFRRLFVKKVVHESPMNLLDFFTKLLSHINAVNAAISQVNDAAQNDASSEASKKFDYVLDQFAELQNFARRKMALLRQAAGQGEKQEIRSRQKMVREVFKNLLHITEQFSSAGKNTLQTIPFDTKQERQSIMARISWLIEEAHVNNQMYEALFFAEAGDATPAVTGLDNKVMMPLKQLDSSDRQDHTIAPSSIQDTPEIFKAKEVPKADKSVLPVGEPAKIPQKRAGKELITSFATTAAPTSAHPLSETVDSFSSEEATQKAMPLRAVKASIVPQPAMSWPDHTDRDVRTQPAAEPVLRQPRSMEVPKYRSTSEPSRRKEFDNEKREPLHENIRSDKETQWSLPRDHKYDSIPLKDLRTPPNPMIPSSSRTGSIRTPPQSAASEFGFEASIDGETSSSAPSIDTQRKFRRPQPDLRPGSFPTGSSGKSATGRLEISSKPNIEFDVEIQSPSSEKSESSSSIVQPQRRPESIKYNQRRPEILDHRRSEGTASEEQPQWQPKTLLVDGPGSSTSLRKDHDGRSALRDRTESATDGSSQGQTASSVNEPTVQLKCVVRDKSGPDENAWQKQQKIKRQTAGGRESSDHAAVIYLSCQESFKAGQSRASQEMTLRCSPLTKTDAKDSFSEQCSQQSLAVKSELQALLKNLNTLRGSCRSGGSHEFSGRDISSLTRKIKQVLRDKDFDNTRTDESFYSHGDVTEGSMQCQWRSDNTADENLSSLSRSKSRDQYTLKCTPYKNSNHVAEIGQLTREHHNVEYLLSPDEQRGDVSCQQHEHGEILAQAATAQPPKLFSAAQEKSAKQPTRIQTIQTQWAPTNLISVDENLQRAVWLLKTINKEICELLQPLYDRSGGPVQVEELVNILRHMTNRIAYLLSSLQQAGQTLPSLALECTREEIQEFETLLTDLLQSHAEHVAEIKTRLQCLRKNISCTDWSSVDAMVSEVQSLLSQLRLFLRGSLSTTDYIESKSHDVPIDPTEQLLCELTKRLEMVADCLDQIKLCEQTPVATPQYTDKFYALLNQHALFHEFLKRWLIQLQQMKMSKDSSFSGVLSNFLSTIICQRSEFKLHANNDGAKSLFGDEEKRQHMQKRIAEIFENSKRNIEKFKMQLDDNVHESSTFELFNIEACKVNNSGSSSSSSIDFQKSASNKQSDRKSHGRQDASTGQDGTKVASSLGKTVHEASAETLTDCQTCSILADDVATSIESATEPASSSHKPSLQMDHQNPSLFGTQSANDNPQLRALLSGLNILQNACETKSPATELSNADSLLAGLENLLQEFHDNQKCGTLSCNAPAQLEKTVAFKTERRSADIKSVPSRLQKIGRLVAVIKSLLTATGQTAQQTVKTKLQMSRVSSSRDALKKLKKSPARRRNRKRSSRELAKKIAALLRDYSCSVGSDSPGPCNQLSTGSSELSQLISNVRGLLPRSSGCRSQGSPGSCSWRRQTRSKHRGRQQENQSNACYDDSVDDDTRRMEIPVSYCGEDAELCRSPTKEFIDAAEGSCKSSMTWDAQSIVSSHVGSNLLSKENDELLSVESEQQVDSHFECVLHNSATAAGGDDSLKIESIDQNPQQPETPAGLQLESSLKADRPAAKLGIASSVSLPDCRSKQSAELEQVLVNKFWMADLGQPGATTSSRLAAAVAELQNLLSSSRGADRHHSQDDERRLTQC